MKSNNGWESIFESAECREVLAKVADLRKKDGPIYPSQKDVFRAFEDCPFEKVRVVILGQDPYARDRQAIGRAFAVPESTLVPPSLKNIFEEVRRAYPRGELPKPTLQSWAKQGVFLLNTALTVKDGCFNSHATIGWKEAVTIPTLKKLSNEREHPFWGAGREGRATRLASMIRVRWRCFIAAVGVNLTCCGSKSYGIAQGRHYS